MSPPGAGDDLRGRPRQLFPPWVDTLARSLIVGVPAAAVVGVLAWIGWYRSPSSTGVGRHVDQPVPFSHAHHVGDIGIDCRYCHGAVEESSFAGMPTTETCMSCHWQLWTTAEVLEPVRESWRSGRPMRWRRVHNLPDFTYFDHSVHVTAGVACETCHGRVDRMPLMATSRMLSMGFCLDCHRDPAGRLRPRDAVFSTGWPPPGEQRPPKGELMKRHRISTVGLTDCTACHR